MPASEKRTNPSARGFGEERAEVIDGDEAPLGQLLLGQCDAACLCERNLPAVEDEPESVPVRAVFAGAIVDSQQLVRASIERQLLHHFATARRNVTWLLTYEGTYFGVVPSLFSSEWFAHLNGVAAGVSLSDGAACRIQFDVGRTRFGLVVDDGKVHWFDRGEIDSPHLELRFSGVDGEALWRHELRDDAAMRAATIVTALSDGVYTGAPAPGDLLGRPELAGLPVMSEASLIVAYTFRRGPFGLVHHWFRFEDGRPVENGFGGRDDADVRIAVEYRAIPLLRSGEQTILEALEGGSIEGALGPITMLAGILDEPEFRAADLATGRHGFALATLGELWADDRWTAALEHLAGDDRSA